MHEVGRVDALGHRRRGGGVVGVDPRPRRRIAREMGRTRHPDVVGRRGQHDVAHLCAARRAVRVLVAGERAGDRIVGNREADEPLGAVRNVAKDAGELELAPEDARQPSGRDRRGERQREVDDAARLAGDRIEELGARLRLERPRVDERELVAVHARERTQRVDHHAAALAVPDDQRPHAVALVLPREHAGERSAVEIAARGHLAGPRIDERRGRVAHALEELAERRHRDDPERPLQQHDARRAIRGERRGGLRVDALAVERRRDGRARRDERAGHRHRGQRRAEPHPRATPEGQRASAGSDRFAPGRKHTIHRASRGGGAPRYGPSGS